jgi:ribose transport system ATP-binding protein
MDGKESRAQLLHLSGASQTFAAVRVLTDVDLTIASGEVVALLGQNGSGKSTLIKILAGYNDPDPGTRLELAGRDVSLPSRGGEEESPLSFVHQDLALSDSMTIAENFGISTWRRRQRFGLGRLRMRRERSRAREALEAFEVGRSPQTLVGELREGERAIVAIARALSLMPREQKGVLVLDEPTASLPRHEVESLFGAIRRVRADGHGVLFVAHRIEEVRAIADRVMVLRDGKVVFAGEMSQTTDEAIVTAIIGRELKAAARRTGEARAGAAIRFSGVVGARLRGVDFTLHHGEVLGMTGLAGMGQDSVADLITGLERVESGEIEVKGRRVGRLSPRIAAEKGIRYLPASRAHGGSLLDASVTENVTMTCVPRYFRSGRIDRRAEWRDTATLLQDLDVRPQDPGARMGSLSGGNQQKVLLAKLRLSGARILVLHEPTHGVDVGARERVLEGIDEMRREGLAILIISKEYEDLVAICDRVLVFGDGMIRAELGRDEVDEHTVATASLNATSEHV